jgi:hypothetical protein
VTFEIISKTPYTAKPMPKGWDPTVCPPNDRNLMATCYDETVYTAPPIKTAETVSRVAALDGNEIRVWLDFTNGQKTSRSFQCVINTTVYNQFGDQVNIRVNSTGSNGNVKPGQTQYIYQDLGVDNGNAKYVTASDVKLLDRS